MPGVVPNAAPADTFPTALYRSFVESRDYAVQINEYRNGESQQRNQVTSSRKAWRLTLRLTPTALATLRTFYNAHPRTAPFYYTPLNESVKTVRFNSPWSQQSFPGRTEVGLEIIEIA